MGVIKVQQVEGRPDRSVDATDRLQASQLSSEIGPLHGRARDHARRGPYVTHQLAQRRRHLANLCGGLPPLGERALVGLAEPVELFIDSFVAVGVQLPEAL